MHRLAPQYTVKRALIALKSAIKALIRCYIRLYNAILGKNGVLGSHIPLKGVINKLKAYNSLYITDLCKNPVEKLLKL